ncbi:MAG: porin, partial [Gammaproteobacteria bacterium]
GMQSALHSGSGENGQGRATNVVGYNSPDYSGFSVAATYSFDEDCGLPNNSNATTTACAADDDSYSLGARYNTGPILVFADYLTNDNGGDDDAWKVGGSYALGDFTVYGQYENDGGLLSAVIDPNNVVNTENRVADGFDIWHVAGSYTMGNAMLYAGYGQGDDRSVGGVDMNSEYDAWTLAGMYNFSQRTLAYMGYSVIDFDEFGEDEQLSIGLRHKF